MRTHLDRAGYRILVASDGEEARVKAVLHRTEQSAATSAPSLVQCGQISIDLVRRRVLVRGTATKLTPTEFQLLQQLALNAGKVLSHSDLLTRVWGAEYRDDREYP